MPRPSIHYSVHTTTGIELPSVRKSSHWLDLLVGLIGAGGDDAPLWLRNTGSVHTFFMPFAIDILFLDRNNVCLKRALEVPPWRIAIGPRGSRSVLETKSGAYAVYKEIVPGDRLEFEALGNEPV